MGRHVQEDFVSGALGAGFALYLITTQGRLMATSVAEETKHADRYTDLRLRQKAPVLEALALMLLKESVPLGCNGQGCGEHAGPIHLDTIDEPVDTFVTPRVEIGEVARFRAE